MNRRYCAVWLGVYQDEFALIEDLLSLFTRSVVLEISRALKRIFFSLTN